MEASFSAQKILSYHSSVKKLFIDYFIGLGYQKHTPAPIISFGDHSVRFTGSTNQLTLQMHAIQKIKIYPGMLIGQVTFWVPRGKIILYKGKYQGSRGPMESQIYKDF